MTGYNGREHVWAGYYGTELLLGICLMGKVEAKTHCDTETLVRERHRLGGLVLWEGELVEQ